MMISYPSSTAIYEGEENERKVMIPLPAPVVIVLGDYEQREITEFVSLVMSLRNQK